MSPNTVGKYIGTKEMMHFKLVIRQLLSEFFGTFMYLALVLSSDAGNINTDTSSSIILKAMASGLLLASIVAIFGHVSGGHINPAITLGALVCKHIKPLKAICYVLMQCAGSIAGAAIAYLISSENIRGNLGATLPFKDLKVTQLITFEFLMTFVLVAVVLSVIDTRRGARGLGSAPITIGLSITACICASGPYTSSLNPVRTLGPAVIMGIWDYHWAYWLGPMSGGLAAGLLYRFMLQYHRNAVYSYVAKSRTNVDKSRSEVEVN